MQKPGSHRAVATVVGGVLLAIALLVLLALYVYLQQEQQGLQEALSSIARNEISIGLLASSIRGRYYCNGSSLYIVLKSAAPRALEVTSIDILWENYTITVIDKSVAGVSRGISLYIIEPGGSASPTSLPAVIAPGDSLVAVIANSTQPLSIVATVSQGGALSAIPLSPGGSGVVLLGYLDKTLYDYTKTWIGRLSGLSGEYLAIGVPGSDEIVFYRLPSLSPMLRVRIEGTLGSSTSYTVLPGPMRIVLINTSGVYVYSFSGAPLYVDTRCASLGENAAIEPVSSSGGSTLLAILRGGGSDEYCVYNVTKGLTLISMGSLSKALNTSIDTDPRKVYVSSARSTDSNTAYFLVYDDSRETPVVIVYNASSNSWKLVAAAPGSFSTGMTYYDKAIYLSLARGGLYELNITQNTWSKLTNTPSPCPSGPGDRLEYSKSLHSLIFVRADGTREVYQICPITMQIGHETKP